MVSGIIVYQKLNINRNKLKLHVNINTDKQTALKHSSIIIGFVGSQAVITVNHSLQSSCHNN